MSNSFDSRRINRLFLDHKPTGRAPALAGHHVPVFDINGEKAIAYLTRSRAHPEVRLFSKQVLDLTFVPLCDCERCAKQSLAEFIADLKRRGHGREVINATSRFQQWLLLSALEKHEEQLPPEVASVVLSMKDQVCGPKFALTLNQLELVKGAQRYFALTAMVVDPDKGDSEPPLLTTLVIPPPSELRDIAEELGL